MDALQRDSDIDLARRLAATSPGFLLLLAAFAFGNASWNAHAATLVLFCGIFAASSAWHQMMAAMIADHYDDAPPYWSSRVRRSIYFSVAAWAVFGYWAGLTHLHGGYFLYIVLTATVAGVATLALASDAILAERSLAILLVPVVSIEIAHCIAGLEPYGYVLATLTTIAFGFCLAIARKLNASLKAESHAADIAAQYETGREVAREIRVPLNGIVGMIAMVLSTELTGQQREYMEVARDRMQKLVGRVDEIGGFSVAMPTEQPQASPVREAQEQKTGVLV